MKGRGGCRAAVRSGTIRSCSRKADGTETHDRPSIGRSRDRAPEGRAGGYGRYGAEQRYFVDCVLQKRPVEGASSPQVARDVQEVIEAVYRSAESGRAVKLPLG